MLQVLGSSVAYSVLLSPRLENIRLRNELKGYRMLLNELHRARRLAGWSQRALASRNNVDAQNVKRLEKGVGSVTSPITEMRELEFRLAGLVPGKMRDEEQLPATRHNGILSLGNLALRTQLSRPISHKRLRNLD